MKTSTKNFYYKLHPSGRDICLTCPLPECVHVDPRLELTDCPLEASDARERVKHERNRHRWRTLQNLERLLSIRSCSVKQLANHGGVGENTIYNWIRSGLLISHLTSARRRIVSGVNWDKLPPYSY